MAYNFKKEEEVQEFIKNLGIEYRFGCFHEKKPEVCHLLGDYFESISRNFARALSIYKNNCDTNNHGHSCFKTGVYYMQGKGMEKIDDYKSMDYFEKGCKLGFYESCYRAAVLCFNSDKRVRDYMQGMALYDKACQHNLSESCYDLSITYLTGDKDKNISKDLKKSAEYATKACDLQHMYACANLSRMYKLGDGVEKNDELFKKYRSIAIELQDQIKRKEEIEFQMGIKV